MYLPLGRACLLALLAGGAAFAQQAAPPPQNPQGQPTFARPSTSSPST
ncbi:MAG TPA: hypothetical protein VES67_24075 [Vicinamibacterales bacterium]|nr:hypothetical protein [Vicinamibacterales bacterium]